MYSIMKTVFSMRYIVNILTISLPIKFQWTSTLPCQLISAIYPDNMVVYILNIIPLSRYSAWHPASEHHESTTQDIKTQDIEISTHNTTSGHRMLMSQHTKTKGLESLNENVCDILKLHTNSRTVQLTKYIHLRVQNLWSVNVHVSYAWVQPSPLEKKFPQLVCGTVPSIRCLQYWVCSKGCNWSVVWVEGKEEYWVWSCMYLHQALLRICVLLPFPTIHPTLTSPQHVFVSLGERKPSCLLQGV